MLNAKTATQALQEWCEKRGVKDGVKEFVAYLRDRDAHYLLPVIKKELQNSAREDAARNSIVTEAGRQLSAKQQQSLRSAFAVEDSDLKEIIDESKIAGVDVTYASQQVRGSVASQLSQLQRDLTSNL